MSALAMNPYLPTWEYVPDGEPHVFGDRLYVFGSHDRFGGTVFCANDYVVWSTPVADLAAWTSHGVAYRADQDPRNPDRARQLYAPDVAQGPDGRFYLYYSLSFDPRLGVAVADAPEGPYEYLGVVAYADGDPVGSRDGDVFPYDPGVLVVGDRVLVYVGFAPVIPFLVERVDRLGLRHEGAYLLELAPDMRTVIAGPTLVLPEASAGAGTGFEAHPFFEAASIRLIDGRYHLAYSSVHQHELCLATSDRPDGGFAFQGVLVSHADIGFQGRTQAEALNDWGTNHGGLVEVGGRWYVFHHRNTNDVPFSRQGLAEPIERDADGRFLQAEVTSAGLHGGPLPGTGTIPASSACVLRAPGGAAPVPFVLDGSPRDHPFLTQSGGDRESDPDQHVVNIREGAVVGFRYVDLRAASSLRIDADGEGAFDVASELDGRPVAIVRCDEIAVDLPPLGERAALYLRYRGSDAAVLRSLTLAAG